MSSLTKTQSSLPITNLSVQVKWAKASISLDFFLHSPVRPVVLPNPAENGSICKKPVKNVADRSKTADILCTAALTK